MIAALPIGRWQEDSKELKPVGGFWYLPKFRRQAWAGKTAAANRSFGRRKVLGVLPLGRVENIFVTVKTGFRS